MKKNLIIAIAILVIITIPAIFLLPNFLLNNFGECHAENDACCKKLGSLSACTYTSMTCDDKNKEPVWKGCDDNCKHIIACVKKSESQFGDDTEINKSCSADSDCKLPMSYALVSSRKYEIKCIDFKCTIIDSSDNNLKTKCCEECKIVFSKSPIGVGPEMAMCGNFGSGQPVSENCKLFFKNNPMSVSACEDYVGIKHSKDVYPKTTGITYFDDWKLINNTDSFLIKAFELLTAEQIQTLRNSGIRKLSASEIETIYHSLIEEDKVKEIEDLNFVEYIYNYQIK